MSDWYNKPSLLNNKLFKVKEHSLAFVSPGFPYTQWTFSRNVNRMNKLDFSILYLSLKLGASLKYSFQKWVNHLWCYGSMEFKPGVLKYVTRNLRFSLVINLPQFTTLSSSFLLTKSPQAYPTSFFPLCLHGHTLCSHIHMHSEPQGRTVWWGEKCLRFRVRRHWLCSGLSQPFWSLHLFICNAENDYLPYLIY